MKSVTTPDASISGVQVATKGIDLHDGDRGACSTGDEVAGVEGDDTLHEAWQRDYSLDMGNFLDGVLGGLDFEQLVTGDEFPLDWGALGECHTDNLSFCSPPDSILPELSSNMDGMNDFPTAHLSDSQVHQLTPDVQDNHQVHLSTLTILISNLETYLRQTSRENDSSVDQILHLLQRTLQPIHIIQTSPIYSSCISCKTLIATTVDLMIQLYDRCLGPEASQPSSSGAETNTGVLPALHLGVFEINLEGMDGWADFRRGIVSAEVRRTLPIIETLQEGCRAKDGSESRKRHEGAFEEMRHRVGELAKVS